MRIADGLVAHTWGPAWWTPATAGIAVVVGVVLLMPERRVDPPLMSKRFAESLIATPDVRSSEPLSALRTVRTSGRMALPRGAVGRLPPSTDDIRACGQCISHR